MNTEQTQEDRLDYMYVSVFKLEMNSFLTVSLFMCQDEDEDETEYESLHSF